MLSQHAWRSSESPIFVANVNFRTVVDSVNGNSGLFLRRILIYRYEQEFLLSVCEHLFLEPCSYAERVYVDTKQVRWDKAKL